MKLKDLWLRFKGMFIKKFPETSNENEIKENNESIGETDSTKEYRERLAKEAAEKEMKNLEELLATKQEDKILMEVLRISGVNSVLLKNPVSASNLLSEAKSLAIDSNLYRINKDDKYELKDDISSDGVMKFVQCLKNNWNIGKDEVYYRRPNTRTFGGVYCIDYKFKVNEDGSVSKTNHEECYQKNQYGDTVRKDDKKETLTYNEDGIETKRFFDKKIVTESPYIGYSSRGGEEVEKYIVEAERDSEDITKVTYTKGEEKFTVDLSNCKDVVNNDYDIATLDGIANYFTKDNIGSEILYKDVTSDPELYEEKKKRIHELVEKSKFSKGCIKYGREMMRE